MSEFYDKIARGLNEAIAFEEGKLPAKTTKYTVAPVTSFAPGEIAYRKRPLKLGNPATTTRPVPPADCCLSQRQTPLFPADPELSSETHCIRIISARVANSYE